MKDIPQIHAAWDIGQFIGANKSHGRVTVEPNWSLVVHDITPTGPDDLPNLPDNGVFGTRTGPFRSFQGLNEPRTATVEVPNIKSIQIDRSIDTDAAGCTIVIYNQWMDNNDGTGADVGGSVQNTIWLLVPTTFAPGGFETWGWQQSDGVTTSDFIFHTDSRATMQAKFEQVYGAGNVVFSPHELNPDAHSIEFVGDLAGENPTWTVTGVVGNIPSYFQEQVGIPNEPGVPGGNIGQLGSPGYFTWNRGNSSESTARWNHIANEWNNVLIPMAMLRTYQGYGGYIEEDDGTLTPMSIEDAVEDGYITITGTWIVDSVNIGTDGLVSLKCRDAAKLLIEQALYPPLVPAAMNPVKYYKWNDETVNPIWDPGGQLDDNGSIGEFDLVYGKWFDSPFAASHTDYLLGGEDTPVMGHFPSSAFDGDVETFSVGNGWEAEDLPHILDYWQANVNGPGPGRINKVNISPWGGPYTVYISIVEGGVWVGDNTIPYGAPGTDPDAAIAYVMQVGVSSFTPQWFDLPRAYDAGAIRITIRRPKVSHLQDGTFRSGLKNVRVGYSAITTGNWTYALARHPNNGYWIIDATTTQFSFGDARDQTKTDAGGITVIARATVAHPTQPGFWVLGSNGRVHTFGAAQQLPMNGTPGNYLDAEWTGADDFQDIAVTHTGNGYWLMRASGGVYSFGDAQYLPGWYMGASSNGEIVQQTPIDRTAAAIVGHPTQMGYWMIDPKGQVGAFFGDDASSQAKIFGQVTAPFPVNAAATTIEPTADGNGYWILYSNGQLFNYGNAQNVGSPIVTSTTPWEHVWWDMVRTNSPLAPYDQGYWLLRADGSIGAFGANYFGRPGATGGGTIRSDGNYADYVEIIWDLLAWSGWLYTQLVGLDSFAWGVNGNLESTGAFSEEPISEDVFDKKFVMDAITTIKEIVGYLFWVDEMGAAHFESPNWWAPGNWFEDGTRTSLVPEIDEATHLFSYSASFDDEDLRSEIIIANQLPDVTNTDTITTTLIPPGQNILRGMTKPALWSNEVFSRPEEQQVMAELIAMHIWFSQRQGNVTCTANPCIQVNDQVRIMERVTSESYIHYVRGVNTSHDLDSGRYDMTLTTHWMGSEEQWAISSTAETNQNEQVRLTELVRAAIMASGSRAADVIEYIA